MKIYIISRGSASIAISTMVRTAKKIMQFGIFVYAEAQEINLRGNLQGIKCDGDCLFLLELFLFYEKVFSPLDPLGLFSKHFDPNPQ